MEQTSQTTFPVTREAWTQWFRRHEDDFYSSMQTVGEQRRNLNKRLHADAAVPAPVSRIGPKMARMEFAKRPRWQQLCWGRIGWYCLQVRPRGVRTLFLYTFCDRTYCMDFSAFRQGRCFVLGEDDELKINEALLALEDLDVGEVAGVAELFLSAASAPDRLCLETRHAQAVEEPLKRSKTRGRTAPDARDAADESSDSAEAPFDKLHDEIQGSSSDSSVPSADTDADSALDDIPKAKKIEHILARHLADKPVAGTPAGNPRAEEVDTESEGESASVEPAVALPRHAPGTWKVWENMWFYMTKTPGWVDVKIWVKHSFRNVTTGMGTMFCSKTLTPHHYEDEWEDPWKTFLLLRSWAIWRARLGGWAKQRDGRLRELERQVARFEADLRAGQAKVEGLVLLGSAPAQALLEKWVPDVVAKVRG